MTTNTELSGEQVLAEMREELRNLPPTSPPNGKTADGVNQWGKPVIACPNPEACNYHGCEAHCRPAAVDASR